MLQKKYIPLLTFLAGAVVTIAFSTYATDIGTNVTITGHLFATSTVQATGNIVGYADLILGTTTPWKGADYVFEQQVGTQPIFLVGDTGTSTPHFVIAADGNVGIGTGSPALGADGRTLTISGGITGDVKGVLELQGSRTNNGAYAAIRSFHGSTQTAGIGFTREGSDDTKGAILFQTNPSTGVVERMRIDNSGNVGIGTTTPASLLSLSSSGTTTVHIGTTSTTKGSCFQMYDAAHVAYRAFISKAGTWTVEAGTCE